METDSLYGKVTILNMGNILQLLANFEYMVMGCHNSSPKWSVRGIKLWCNCGTVPQFHPIVGFPLI